MPAEWATHASTWLTWPTNKTTWPGKLLQEVESIYVRMIEALLRHEKVNLLVHDGRRASAVARRLKNKNAKTQNLIFHEVKTVDTWIRDYGPIFVKRTPPDPLFSAKGGSAPGRKKRGGEFNLPPSLFKEGARGSSRDQEKVFVKFRFNAWGGKYADLARDNGVVNRVTALQAYDRFDVDVVLEGGSIDTDGQGTFLTTEQCLLNRNRNPRLKRKNIEDHLKNHLGARRVIWLKEGIEGDDTDGHVDDITRFVGPRTVLTAVEADTADKNHRLLDENLKILRRSKDAEGRSLRIVELPMPGRVGVGRKEDASERLPASYANFYIANGTVLLPVYSHRNDGRACGILKKVFPDRKIVPIECTALVYGLGSIHCVTQQEPL